MLGARIREKAKMPMKKIQVVRTGPGWAVKGTGIRPARVFPTRAAAERAATRAIQERQLRGFILGRADFEKISAVEGVRVPKEMKVQFRRFDREGASGAERRRVLKDKYGTGAN
jgi:hypothetical protein